MQGLKDDIFEYSSLDLSIDQTKRSAFLRMR